MQKLCKRICDHSVIDSRREQTLLRFARKIRPNLKRGVAKQGGKPILIH
ncbi:hypothetical protein [Bradyrhizobium sp. dw_411]